jgi:hypothetical protein
MSLAAAGQAARHGSEGTTDENADDLRFFEAVARLPSARVPRNRGANVLPPGAARPLVSAAIQVVLSERQIFPSDRAAIRIATVGRAFVMICPNL